MREPSDQRPSDLLGPLPPPVPPTHPRVGEITGGVVLIIAGSALALPAGFCSTLMIGAAGRVSGGIDSISIAVVAAAVALVGGCLIWWGCRLALKDGPVRYLFGVIVAVLIVVVFLLTMSLAALSSSGA